MLWYVKDATLDDDSGTQTRNKTSYVILLSFLSSSAEYHSHIDDCFCFDRICTLMQVELSTA